MLRPVCTPKTDQAWLLSDYSKSFHQRKFVIFADAHADLNRLAIVYSIRYAFFLTIRQAQIINFKIKRMDISIMFRKKCSFILNMGYIVGIGGIPYFKISGIPVDFDPSSSHFFFFYIYFNVANLKTFVALFIFGVLASKSDQNDVS